MSAEPRIFTADRGDTGRRLDLVLRRHLADVEAATRSRIQSWIAGGRVCVNGTIALRAATRAALGDVLTVVLPEPAPRLVMAAEPVPLEILFEDDHIVIVNKPAGLVVHPGYRNAEGTLMNGLLFRARRWAAGQRPSIVGRLDKHTSGIVVCARTAAAHAAFQRAMALETATKEYLAIVYGRVNVARGRIDLRLSRHPRDRRRVVASPANGAASLTMFERLARVAAPKVGLSLVCCRLITGRTHQIRAHLAARGWPIVGDSLYGGNFWVRVADPALSEALCAFNRQALHAWRLNLRHPFTGSHLGVEAPLPSDFGTLLTQSGLATGSITTR